MRIINILLIALAITCLALFLSAMPQESVNITTIPPQYLKGVIKP
jgi:hypothetical protein